MNMEYPQGGTVPGRKQEGKKAIDYLKVFTERLSAAQPFSDEDAEYFSGGLRDIGVTKLKKDMPTLIITKRDGFEQDFDLFVKDRKEIDNKSFPHSEVEADLANFLGISRDDPKFPKFPISAYILEDEKGVRYLSVDKIPTTGIGFLLNDEDSRVRFLSLLKRYGISKVIGLFEKKLSDPEDSNVSYITHQNEVMAEIDFDFVGQKREDLMFINIALKYKMTNSQFMRFRILAKSDIDSFKKGEFQGTGRKLRNLDDLAKEVVADDKE